MKFGKVNPPKRLVIKGGQLVETKPDLSGDPNPAYITPKESRQSRWRKKNKAKVAAYMRGYRAKQKGGK